MNKPTEKRTLTRTMRSLHRDIGFLMIGLTLMYCLSGIVLIYRDSGFLKFENHVETDIDRGLTSKELEAALHLRRITVERLEAGVIHFNNGEYNVLTGHASYTLQEYPWLVRKFNALHLSPSSSAMHYFGIAYGLLLIFLALSSLLMYKPGTKSFRRGITLSSAGVAMAVMLMFIG
ncbi:MAG: hypothetical protein AB7D39_11255 [Pseudodesulfovibrio sp.]|uniref:hypothetical protein n=1 Tax=Pseudodesulfovibrio sp. TaxID=2035812 RepID=UPI003D0C676C